MPVFNLVEATSLSIGLTVVEGVRNSPRPIHAAHKRRAQKPGNEVVNGRSFFRGLLGTSLFKFCSSAARIEL